MKGTSLFFRWLIPGIGVICFLVSGGWLAESLHFAAGAVKAQGTVTRLEWVADSDGSVAHPIIRFHDGERSVEIRGRVGSSPPAYAVGERVPLLYHPGRPEDARPATFSDRYLLPLGFSGLGLAAVIASAVAIHREKNRQKAESATPALEPAART